MRLLRNVTIIDDTNIYNGKNADILIDNDGKISKIAPPLSITGDFEVFEADNAHVCIGLCDVGTFVGEPGLEHREDFASVAKAAASGGFTTLATFPNTEPAVQTQANILFIKTKTQSYLVDFEPIGALSENCAGKDIAEMLDMNEAGVRVFSDGKKSVQSGGLMIRALQYSKIIDGLIINTPYDKTVVSHGQMHEGTVSTMLGLVGLPSMSEELMLARDLQILEYTEGRLHIQNISTAGSVAQIRAAKQKGLRVTASVVALNLVYTDAELTDFDTNFKVMPPLRDESDRLALIEGLKDGTIDFISTNHTPIDTEGKNLEFTYADFGATGLETTLALLLEKLSNTFTYNDLVRFLAINPRKVLGYDIPQIAEGSPANITIFSPTKEWQVTEKTLQSKSKNCPLLGNILRGGVLGVINKGKVILN